MKTVIVACRTLQAEIELAMEKTGVRHHIEYIESGLHERPAKLARIVQELLNTIEADRVLLCLGQCGNSMVGIKAGSFEMVLPKVDDCLSLLIGSTKEKSRLSYQDHAFFLTKGWLLGESTIMSQYQKSVEKYGEDTALSIMEMMYEHYDTLGLIDTGTGPMDELYRQTEDVAKLLDLSRKTYPGTVSYIEQLLTGPWPEEKFIVKKPFETIKTEDYNGMM